MADGVACSRGVVDLEDKHKRVRSDEEVPSHSAASKGFNKFLPFPTRRET